MPPPTIAPSLLKAVTVPFDPLPAVFYAPKKPSHMLRCPLRVPSINYATATATATAIAIVAFPNRRGGVLIYGARFEGEGRWMGDGSGRASSSPSAGEGRKRAGAMGSEETKDRAVGATLGLGCHHEENGGYMQQDSPRLLTLPTLLTLARVAAVPVLVSTYHMNGWWATTATTSIFLAAAFTDWLDGYIARKMRLGTAFGAFLDPVADKLMVAATLVLLCTKPVEVSTFGEVPWLLTVPAIAIIGREITMSAVREWAASQNSRVLEAVAVNSLGKWKTATQMTALTILLAARDHSLIGPGVVVASGVLLLYISAGLALWSLVVYMRKIWRILLK